MTPSLEMDGSKGIFSSEERNSKKCLEHFHKEGWILIKNFYDYQTEILPIHEDVNNLINQKRISLTLPPLDKLAGEINNEAFFEICRHDRKMGGQIYRACRHFPSTISLLTSKSSMDFAKLLMGTNYLNLVPFLPLRVDMKGEEKYLLDWHQDYPYIQGSMDGIVIWTPMFNQRKGEGGVTVLPQSHLNGVRKVHIVDPQNKNNQNGGNSILIENVETYETLPFIYPEVSAGDALIFHTLLIHKSMPLTHEAIRWSLQYRYCNFNNQDAVKRGWPNGMFEGNWFEFDHPEYVVSQKSV